MQPSTTLPPMQDSLLPIDEDEAHDQAEVSQTTTDNLITTESYVFEPEPLVDQYTTL